MKVLLTGCTATHVGSSHRLNDFSDKTTILEKVLPELGHEVERRTVKPGENLDAYDAVIVGVTALNGLSSVSRRYGALWALTFDHAIAFPDDWQWRNLVTSLQYENSVWKVLNLDRLIEAMPYRAEIEAVRRRYSGRFPRALMGLFNWGDRSVITDYHSIEKLYTWDPTPFVPVYGDYRETPKRREWGCAALSNQDKWFASLDATWPIHSHTKPEVGTRKRWQIGEGDVCRDVLSERWGALVPYEKDVNGSGWYRSRYVYSLRDCHQVLYTAPGEWPEGYASIASIESLGDGELESFARFQRVQFYKHVLSREEELDRLNETLKRVASGD